MNFVSFLFVFFMTLVGMTADAAIPPCYKEMERGFYKPELVQQALSFHLRIYQSTWSAINSSLQRKAQNVPDIVKRKASKMHPNPLDIPFDPEVAGQVLEQILIDILAQTLAEFNIKNHEQVLLIFNFIKEKQIAKWQACFTPLAKIPSKI